MKLRHSLYLAALCCKTKSNSKLDCHTLTERIIILIFAYDKKCEQDTA